MSKCKIFFVNSLIRYTTIFKPITYYNIFQKMPFYAVASGRKSGIFETWPECESQVKGFSGARYKKFNTLQEANNFIWGNSSAPSSTKENTYNNIGASCPLKRSKSTVTHSKSTISKTKTIAPKKKQNESSSYDASYSYDDSDSGGYNSDDVNEIMKKMDDIEKRIDGVKTNVDKIESKQIVADKKGQRTAIMLDKPLKRSQSMHEGGEVKKKKINNQDFEIDKEGFVHVYTDGACSNNGTRTAKAGLGVYFGENHPLNQSCPVKGRATNNCGEIQAATKAIKLAHEAGVQKLCINTDSQFVINSVTKWMYGWKSKGWKLRTGAPVKNVIDFKALDAVRDYLQIRWNYVEAHKGILGNERADQLAKQGAAVYTKKSTK